jgi:hypothetical protein
VLPTLETAMTGHGDLREFGVAFVVAGLCLAEGLAEVVRACGPRVAGRAAAAGLAILAALAQLHPRQSWTPPVQGPAGVERLSSLDVKHLVAVLPDRTVLVEEDAIVATLLRAQRSAWSRMGKTLRLAGRDPAQLAPVVAGPAPHVFALPDGQADLQWLGFKLSEAGLPGVSGLASVEAGWPCDAVTTHWDAASSIVAARSPILTVSSPSVRAGHGIVVYVAIPSPEHPLLLGDQPARSGFQQDVYDESNGSDRAALEALDRNDHVPPRFAGALQPFVARLDIWRGPDLPTVLPVQFDAVPTMVVAKSSSAGEADWICPAFPYDVRPIRITR